MMRAIGFVRTAVTLLAISMAVASTGAAQSVGVVQSDILVLDTERLLAETLLGQRLTAEFQAEREKLIARNRKIEAELEAEELALTNLRGEKTPQEFRELADTFDAKVQEIRRESDLSVRDIERSRELGPVEFMRAVEPVLVQMMRDANGAVIMDRRSVLLRADVVDITDLAISRIDTQIGDGTSDAPKSAD